MKRILLSLFLLAGAFATLSAATLEASTRQAVYPGTNIPRLTIVSGSGKTSYVSGVIDDPNDPAANMRSIADGYMAVLQEGSQDRTAAG